MDDNYGDYGDSYSSCGSGGGYGGYDSYGSDDLYGMDYADEAYAAGLDVNDYATFEELLDDLHNASGSYASGGAGGFSSRPATGKPAAKAARRAPYVPPAPEPPGIGVLFPIYIIAMAILILGALTGLIGYGRGDDWTGWAALIFVTIFLFILPICLKVSWYRADTRRYNQKMKEYKRHQR